LEEDPIVDRSVSGGAAAGGGGDLMCQPPTIPTKAEAVQTLGTVSISTRHMRQFPATDSRSW